MEVVVGSRRDRMEFGMVKATALFFPHQCPVRIATVHPDVHLCMVKVGEGQL